MSLILVRQGVRPKTKAVPPDLTPPPAPSGLVATLTDTTTATITAVDNSGGTAYHEILRRRSDQLTGIAIERTNPGEPIIFIDADLPPGFEYFYSARALFIRQGVDVFSDPTAEDSVTVTPPVEVPDAPVQAAVSNITGVSALYSWANVANETFFEVYRDTVTIPDPPPSSALIAVIVADGLSHPDTGLNQATDYFVRVRAVNVTGAGALSNERTFTTQATVAPPAAPSQSAVGSITASSALASWGNVANETGFEVFLDTVTIPDPPPIGKRVAIVGANVLSAPLTGLAELTGYFVRVRAVNTGGPSALSNQQTFTTGAATGALPFSRWVHYKDASLGLEVDASNSMDPDGGALTYDIDWGDGSAHGSTVVANHTYAAPGVYDVRVTVTEPGGNSEAIVRSIRIANNNDPVFQDDFSTVHTTGQPPAPNVQNGYRFQQQTGPYVVTDEHFLTGSRSLRIRHNAKPHGQFNNPELHFILGEELCEIWIHQRIYIPDGTEVVGSPPRTLNRYFHRGAGAKTFPGSNISAGSPLMTTTSPKINRGDIGKEITFAAAYTLTGAVDFDGTLAVIGVGTSFLSQVNPGDSWVWGTSRFVVSTVADNTHLTLLPNAAGPMRFITAVASTDVITNRNTNGNGNAVNHNLTDGTAVIVRQLVGGAGLSEFVVYYVRDATATTFKLAATLGGAAIDITSDMTDGRLSLPGYPAVASAQAVRRVVTIVDVDDDITTNPFQVTLSSNAINPVTNGTASVASYGGENNKLLIVFPYINQYAGNNVLWGPYMRQPVQTPDRINTMPGDSTFTNTYEVEEDPKALYKHGHQGYPHFIGDQGSPALMKRGQWNDMVYHTRYARNRVVNDGVLESYINGTLLQTQNLPFQLTPDNPLNLPQTRFMMHTFYFPGTQNSGYNEETDFYYDVMRIWDVKPPTSVIP